MVSKEETENAYWEGYIQKQNKAIEICKECKYIKRAKKLENELNNLNAYILVNGIDKTLKTATQIKVENQHNYLHQEEVKILKSIINNLKTRDQKLIDKLEKDIINITKTMQDGNHWDDYSRCRLKAYRTKTKEILKIVKGENDD